VKSGHKTKVVGFKGQNTQSYRPKTFKKIFSNSLPERDYVTFGSAIANPSVVCNVRAPYSGG